MNDILSRLQEKNHYLEKFYSLNEVEMSRFKMGLFETLEDFYQTREKILDILNYIDLQLDEAYKNLPENFKIQDSDKNLLAENIKIKDIYVAKILDQDLEILSFIEQAKSNLIKELQEIKKAKKAVGGYKSKVFGQRLDEEI